MEGKLGREARKKGGAGCLAPLLRPGCKAPWSAGNQVLGVLMPFSGLVLVKRATGPKPHQLAGVASARDARPTGDA